MKALYSGSGVYVFRTRRPGLIGKFPAWLGLWATLLSVVLLWIEGLPLYFALLGLLFNSRHFAYVGETTAMNLRRMQHLQGGGRYAATRKPWSDLEPKHYAIPLPGAPRWALRSVETVLIALLWPVYNHKKNLWNPRRIPLKTAEWQRITRDKVGWCVNFRVIHLAPLVVMAFLIWGR